MEQDAFKYRSRGRKAPPAEASGDTPTINQADIADPAEADHQILLSRIWSDVYGLRAELIERERWRGQSETDRRFTEAADGALWYLARLLTQLDRYLDQYGTAILHGESEFNAESLIRLAGWTGDVTDAQSRELRYLLKRVGEWDRAAFTSALRDPSH